MPFKAEYENALPKAHSLHSGVYRRVSAQLGVDPSYVSRVATGKRKGTKVRRALLDDFIAVASSTVKVSPLVTVNC